MTNSKNCLAFLLHCLYCWKINFRARAPRRGPNLHTTDKPRLIVFIIGGATYSECRVAHEVATSSEWDVIVGGTHILTLRQFIEDLGEFASETTGKAVKDFFSERLKY